MSGGATLMCQGNCIFIGFSLKIPKKDALAKILKDIFLKPKEKKT